MTDLKKLVTVVVISARDLRVIPPGLRLALDSGLRVIISRPESLPRIDHLSHDRLEIIYGNQSFFHRLYLALNCANTPYVFLSADDDFIVIDNLLPAIHQMMMDQSISIAAQTLYATRIDKLFFRYTECYNHFKFVKPEKRVSLQSLAYDYFNPLALDFYTLYDRQKLLYLFQQLVLSGLNDLWALDLGMKSIQFFLASFVALSGTISNRFSTLYIRDRNSKPLRFNKVNSPEIHPNLSLRDDYIRIRSNTNNFRLVSEWSSEFFGDFNATADSFDQFYLHVERYSLQSLNYHTYSLGLSKYSCNIGISSLTTSEFSFNHDTNSPDIFYQIGNPLPEYHFCMTKIYPTYFMASDRNRASLKSFTHKLLSNNL